MENIKRRHERNLAEISKVILKLQHPLQRFLLLGANEASVKLSEQGEDVRTDHSREGQGKDIVSTDRTNYEELADHHGATEGDKETTEERKFLHRKN